MLDLSEIRSGVQNRFSRGSSRGEVHNLGRLTSCTPPPLEVFARIRGQALGASHFIIPNGGVFQPQAEDRWHHLVAFTPDPKDQRIVRHFPLLETAEEVGFLRETFGRNQQWKVAGTLAEPLEQRAWRNWTNRVTTMMRLGMPVRDIQIEKEDLGDTGTLVKVAFAYPDHVALRNAERILRSEGCKSFAVISPETERAI